MLKLSKENKRNVCSKLENKWHKRKEAVLLDKWNLVPCGAIQVANLLGIKKNDGYYESYEYPFFPVWIPISFIEIMCAYVFRHPYYVFYMSVMLWNVSKDEWLWLMSHETRSKLQGLFLQVFACKFICTFGKFLLLYASCKHIPHHTYTIIVLSRLYHNLAHHDHSVLNHFIQNNGNKRHGLSAWLHPNYLALLLGIR